jgi:hypothetical protein
MPRFSPDPDTAIIKTTFGADPLSNHCLTERNGGG